MRGDHSTVNGVRVREGLMIGVGGSSEGCGKDVGSRYGSINQHLHVQPFLALTSNHPSLLTCALTSLLGIAITTPYTFHQVVRFRIGGRNIFRDPPKTWRGSAPGLSIRSIGETTIRATDLGGSG